MLMLASTVLAASLALGEVEQEENLLHEFGNLISGRWIGKVSVEADWPGVGKKGDKVMRTNIVRWIVDGNGLEIEWYMGEAMGKGIFYYEPTKDQIGSVGIETNGGISKTTIKKNDGKWIWTARGSYEDGKKYEVKGTTTFAEDGSTYTDEYDLVQGEETGKCCNVYERLSK